MGGCVDQLDFKGRHDQELQGNDKSPCGKVGGSDGDIVQVSSQVPTLPSCPTSDNQIDNPQYLLSGDASDVGFVDPTSGCDHYHHRDYLSDVPYVDSCHTCVHPIDYLHTVT